MGPISMFTSVGAIKIVLDRKLSLVAKSSQTEVQFAWNDGPGNEAIQPFLVIVGDGSAGRTRPGVARLPGYDIDNALRGTAAAQGGLGALQYLNTLKIIQ